MCTKKELKFSIFLILHTLGTEYLVEDITEYAREKGAAV